MLQASQPAPNSCLSSQISFYQCFICIERDLHAKQYFGNILQLLLLKFLREAASFQKAQALSQLNHFKTQREEILNGHFDNSGPVSLGSNGAQKLTLQGATSTQGRADSEEMMSQLGERPSACSPFHSVVESPTRLCGLIPILSADEGQNIELDIRTKTVILTLVLPGV